MANRNCTISAVPSWVIMALLEDIVRYRGQLLDYLVMALDDSDAVVMDSARLKWAVEKLMMNVLLSSLVEDGHIEVGCGLLDEPLLFDFHNRLDVEIALTPSGEKAHVGQDLALFGRDRRDIYE
jgi:hypothetical protein